MSTPKCPRCQTSVYPMEAIGYDNHVYHKTCFKCLNCSRTVTLGKVAMFQGDLYCKNCYLRMFAEKGNYNVFSDKNTMNKAMTPRSSAGDASEAQAAAGDADQAKEKQDPAMKAMIAQRRARVASNTAGEEAADDAGSEAKEEPSSPKAKKSDEPEGFQQLLTAMRAKSVKDVTALMEANGLACALQPVDRKSAIERGFGELEAPVCASTALAIVFQRVTEMEAELEELRVIARSLKEKEKEKDIAAPIAASPPPAAAEPAGASPPA